MASSINASTTAGVVTTADTSGVLNLQTAGTTAIAISASQAVSLAGTLGVSGRISVSATNPSIQQTVQNSYLDLCGGTTVGTDPSIQIAGSTTVSDANTVFYNSNAHLFRTSSGGTTISRFNQYGIGLSTATPSSGVGITFPATQSASSNANTLDDYEEGAWTPIITNGTTNVTSYFYNVGRYTKIGRSVSITMQISVNVVGISSGTLSITGLPFPMADTEITTQTANAMLGFKYYPVTGTVLYQIGSTANTTMGLAYPASYPTGISYADIATGGQWYLNATYFTT